jgi:hypothetical protein
MAVVETPDRIMTTGMGDGNGSMWMLMMFAFLFLFRGRDGFGGGDGYGGGDVYKRHDAEFGALNRSNFDLQKETLNTSWASRLQNEQLGFYTNQNIKDVSCEVAKQGELTRAHETSLVKDQTIAALTAQLAEAKANENCLKTARLVKEELRNDGYGHGGNCAPHFYRPVMAYDQPIRYAPTCNPCGDNKFESFI